MSDGLLVFNSGSSSLKFGLYVVGGEEGGLVRRYRGLLDGLGSRPHLLIRDAEGKVLDERAMPEGTDHTAALAVVMDWVEQHLDGLELAAVGHRVVHGGPVRAQPAVVDDALLLELEALAPLAPLHQPHNIAAIRAIARVRPQLTQVACFDTAFHRSQPMVAQRYALPEEYAERGIVRCGFHGLSYEYIAQSLPYYDREAAAGRTVVAHLGNGSSMCALLEGRSVDTTMGLTALDGLPMGQRSGAIDPGVLLHLLQHDGMPAEALKDLLYQRSGLLGVSGVSSDMRELLASDTEGARRAIELYCYRVRIGFASMAAALGGLDAIVFTGGIGENAAPIRDTVCRELAWLGLDFDPAANTAHGPQISRTGSRVRAWIIPTNEELMIARHTLRRIAA